MAKSREYAVQYWSIFTAELRNTIGPVQVVPGRAGGGSFKRKKNYIAKKEFAYRECAQDDRPLRCPNFFLRLNEAFAVAWL